MLCQVQVKISFEWLEIIVLKNYIKNPGASLVAQWEGNHLPMQGTWVAGDIDP